MSADGTADDNPGLQIGLTIVFGVLALVFVTVIALVGLQVVGGVTDTAGGDPVNKTEDISPTVGQYVKFDKTGEFEGNVLQVFRVNDSTGQAIRLDGSDDSYVQSRESFTIADDDTFTVCSWGRVRSGAETTNMTLFSAGGRALIQYEHNGTAANWTGWYHDDGSSQSYRVNVTAPNQPGNLTNVCLWTNSTHISIYRNNTQGELKNVTVTSGFSANANSSNWNGTVDESRVFDDALNDSQRQALVNDPVGALPNGTRRARIMYDEGSGTVTDIYWSSPATKADVNNGVWVTGLAGNVLVEGTDYEVRERTAGLLALDGGRLDGAPVAWVYYEFEDSDVSSLVPGIRGGFDLLAAAVLVIPAVAVLGALLFGLVVAVRQAGDLQAGRRRGGGR